ncbi:DUF6364 family protein [Mariniphaga sp.]|uniref:DUF6364 family protein n=1 Tax=Mariniphaga sp. TaxID=1954475 RepID=UPI0035647DDC
MATRLNITVDKTVVEEAKQYAREHGRSLSGLIEEYLKSLISKRKKEIEPGTLVKSLWGSVKPMSGGKDYNELVEEEILKKHLKQ